MPTLPDLLLTGRTDATATTPRAAEHLDGRLVFEAHLVAVAEAMRDALDAPAFADAPPLLAVAFSDYAAGADAWGSHDGRRATLEFADGARLRVESGGYGQVARVVWKADTPADEPEGAYRGLTVSRPGEVTTALSRCPVAVARDVLRRALPAASAHADACRDALAEHRRGVAQREATAERLRAVGVVYTGARYSATFEGERFEGVEMIRNASGGRVEVRIRSNEWLSPEAAERLLPELARLMGAMRDETRGVLATS